eukprot:3002926-Rhodomonas_salina.1
MLVHAPAGQPLRKTSSVQMARESQRVQNGTPHVQQSTVDKKTKGTAGSSVAPRNERREGSCVGGR